MIGSRRCLIWCCALFLTANGCSDISNMADSGDGFASAAFEMEEDVASQTRLRLTGVTGSVSITGSENASAMQISGERIVESESDEDAAEHLQNVDVRLYKSENEISIATIQPQHSDGRNYTVNYTVTVPEHMESHITLVTGTVDVRAMENTVSVNSVTGLISLAHCVGNAWVTLVTGNIDIRATLPSDGTFNFSTVTGMIRIDVPRTTSAHFSAGVVTGNISVSGIEYDVIEDTPTGLRAKMGDGRGIIHAGVVTGDIRLYGF